MQLRGATASHVGNVRDSNQDRVHFGGYTGVVADGMGGHQGGEMAASIAISEFVDVVDPIPPGGLVELVEEANRAVFERAADPDLRGMGTTLVALTLRPTEEKVSVVNVGDSRAYFLRDDEFGQLTLDHSLVEDLVRQNRLTRDEALTHPQRNILTRALGIASQVEVDRFLVPTRIGDRFLLCSDGLFNEVTEDGIIAILRDCPEPNDAADQLVAAAIAAAGRDNVTVAVVDVVVDGDGGDVSSMAAETLLVPATNPGAGGGGDVLEMNSGGPVGGGRGAAAGVDLAEAPNDVDVEQFVDDPVDDTQRAGVHETDALALDESPELDEGHLRVRLDDDTDPVAVETSEVPLGAPRKRRGLRVLLGLLGLAAIAAVVYFGVGFWADSAWYVDTVSDSDDTLAVFRGRPDGFLWTEPSRVAVLEDGLDQLTNDAQNEVRARRSFGSEAEAVAFIEGLEREAAVTGEDLSAAADDTAADAAAEELEVVVGGVDPADDPETKAEVPVGDDSSSTATTSGDSNSGSVSSDEQSDETTGN